MAEASSSRPRRSTRVPAKGPEIVVPTQTSSSRSPKKTRDPEAQLEHLLTNPKSKLTTIDMTFFADMAGTQEVVSYENFLNLSPESQVRLCSLLPPTAFTTFQPTVDPTHPAKADPSSSSDATDQDVERSPATLDPLFFTSPYLLSAAQTFQDHIFSGWLAQKAKEDVEKYNVGVWDTESNVRAEWKDEEWNREHAPPRRAGRSQTEDLDLAELARRSEIQEGDILVYKRRFPNLQLTVEKDLVVCSINQHSCALNFFVQPGSTTSLPGDLLVVAPAPPKPPILTVEDILSSSELELTLLDIDGRVPRGDRFVSNLVTSASLWSQAHNVPQDVVAACRAAKALTIWRWREEILLDTEMQMSLERGARTPIGSVFYVRRMR